MSSAAASPLTREQILTDGFRRIGALLVDDNTNMPLRPFIPDARERSMNLSCGHVVTIENVSGMAMRCGHCHQDVRVHSIATYVDYVAAILQNNDSVEDKWKALQTSCRDSVSYTLLSHPENLPCGHVVSRNVREQLERSRMDKCPECSANPINNRSEALKMQAIALEVSRIMKTLREQKVNNDDDVLMIPKEHDVGDSDSRSKEAAEQLHIEKVRRDDNGGAAAAEERSAEVCCCMTRQSEPQTDILSALKARYMRSREIVEQIHIEKIERNESGGAAAAEERSAEVCCCMTKQSELKTDIFSASKARFDRELAQERERFMRRLAEISRAFSLRQEESRKEMEKLFPPKKS